jgi:hypothetical protein
VENHDKCTVQIPIVCVYTRASREWKKKKKEKSKKPAKKIKITCKRDIGKSNTAPHGERTVKGVMQEVRTVPIASFRGRLLLSHFRLPTCY